MLRVAERPPPRAAPELDAQLRSVQAQRAWLAEGNQWQSHYLAMVLFFRDRPRRPLTFTGLDAFCPREEPGRVWISGRVLESSAPIRRDFEGITGISSEIVSKAHHN